MGFSDFVRKTLEKERGYRYAGRYSTEHTGNKVKLYHYGTEIIRYDIDKQKIELGQGWSASDRDAVNGFIYQVARHFGLEDTPNCSLDSGSSWYRKKRQRHRIDAVQDNGHMVLWRVKKKGEIPQLTLDDDYVNPEYSYGGEPSLCNSKLWGFRRCGCRRRSRSDARQLDLYEVVVIDEFQRLKAQDLDRAIEFAYEYDERLVNRIIDEHQPKAAALLRELIGELNLQEIRHGKTSYLIVPSGGKEYYIDEMFGNVFGSLVDYSRYCIVTKTNRKFPKEDVIIAKILALATGKYDVEKGSMD